MWQNRYCTKMDVVKTWNKHQEESISWLICALTEIICFFQVSWDFSKVFLFKNLNCFNDTGITIVIQFLMWKKFWKFIYRYKGCHSCISYFSKRKVIIYLSIWCISSLCPQRLHCVSIDLDRNPFFKHNWFLSLLAMCMPSFHLCYFFLLLVNV